MEHPIKFSSQLIVWLIKWFIPNREAEELERRWERVKTNYNYRTQRCHTHRYRYMYIYIYVYVYTWVHLRQQSCCPIDKQRPYLDAYKSSQAHVNLFANSRLLSGQHPYPFMAKRRRIACIYLWEGCEVGAACFMPPSASLTRCLFSQLTAGGWGCG